MKLGNDDEAFWRDCILHPDPDPEFGMDNPMVRVRNPFTRNPVDDEIEAVVECIPVAREGFPAPVGWQVLEVQP